jgi:cytochrome P450
MKIILADIVRRYEFSATRPWAPPAIERRNLTLGPHGGVEILVHRAR